MLNDESVWLTNFGIKLLLGDSKREEIQELDGVLTEENKFSDVNEETWKVLGIPQVFAEKRNNHEQRMGKEVPKSTSTPVSDEITYASWASKKGKHNFCFVSMLVLFEAFIHSLNCKEIPSETDIRGFAISDDSISVDDKSAERVENVRKIDA